LDLDLDLDLDKPWEVQVQAFVGVEGEVGPGVRYRS